MHIRRVANVENLGARLLQVRLIQLGLVPTDWRIRVLKMSANMH